MVASRQARAGIPISVRLILATSIVVTAAVGTATWFSQTSIRELTESQIAARRLAGEQAIIRESELTVQAVASAIALPLSNNMDAEIVPTLEAALKKSDHVTWFAVVDRAKAVRGTTGAPKDLEPMRQLLADGVKHVDIAHARVGTGTEWVYSAPVVLGVPQGEIVMGVSTAAFEAELGAALAAAQDRAVSTRNRMWMVSLVVLVIGILLAALYGIQLSRPIKALTLQADRISTGDLSSHITVKRRDELGVLADAFNIMQTEIRDLLVEQAQKASLEKEMSLARQVQQAMLPSEQLDEHGNLKIVGYCMPASSCGGDWWTYRKLSNGRMLVVIGDATGHGIHSAMIAATARGAVEALSGIDERLLTPEQVLRAIDSSIRQVGDHNVIMTAFAAVFDSMSGVLHYANAGQNFPYIVKLGATRVLEEASIIAASGNPLGDRHIAVEIRRGSLQLRPGDLFVCFTDGVVERANPQGKLFGDRRLRGALTGQPLPDAGALSALRDRIVQAIERYAEGKLAEDDVTLVLCQFDPPVAVSPGRREVAGRGAA